MQWSNAVSLFFLGLSSLFPLINPVGTALIVHPYFAGQSHADRRNNSLTICMACLILGIAALLVGSKALQAMGVSIPTTQMAGGIIIARMGLGFLDGGAQGSSASPHKSVQDSLFYPIAFPLTLGPGGISALITLSAHAHSTPWPLEGLLVLSASLLAVLIITHVCFTYSDALIKRVGTSGSLVLNRLMAFLVFCVGIQMFVGGFSGSFPKLAG